MGRILNNIVTAGALAALAGAAAQAQETSNTVIGPPQLKDFQLTPRERIVTQPQPAPAPPPAQTQPAGQAQPSGQAPAQPRPRETAPARPAAERPAPGLPPVRDAAPPPPAAADLPAPPPAQALPLPPPSDLPPAADSGDAAPEPAAVPAEESGGWRDWWPYALAALALGLVALAAVRRRRRGGAIREAVSAAAAAAPPPPPPAAPQPRPWLELELRTERASFTDGEALIAFELGLRNTGRAAARNLRVDVKMFNAGREQDKEIGSFFRTAGRETTRLSLPGLAAGAEGWIRGEVALPREEMRAVQLDDKLLFIPVVAVNTLYDYGEEGRTGQTSRSYVVGRELQEKGEKMGPFRVDQGPRVWRTVGHRPHKVTRRV